MSKIPLFLCMFALAACGPKVELGPLPPPDDRLTCAPLPVKPDLTPLEAIKLPDGTLVYRKADVDGRDGAIARYIVALNGAYFDCRRAVDWNRDYWQGVR